MKMTENTDAGKICFWILVLVGVVSLVVFLGFGLFNTKGEPREAIVALSMLQSGDWICPVNNGVDIAYKPPFFHWCVALCSLVAGHVTEFTSRLPSALATILMVLVGYRSMLKNKVDCRLCLLTGLVTYTAFEVHRAGVNCRVDMMLSSMTVIAIYMFHGWYVSRRKWMIPLIILSMSAAALTKGPVGIVLPCAVLGVYMLVRRENFFRAFGVCLAFALASCVLPLVWYCLAYQERGEAFLYLVYEENILRFTGKMAYSSHEAPAIYNVVTVVAGLLPYTLLLVVYPFTLRWRLPQNCLAKCKTFIRKMPHRISSMSDQDLLAFLSISIIFLFYCVPKSKRSVYLLPIYPFLAYYIARFILFFSRKNRKAVVIYGNVLAVVVTVIPLMLALVRAGVFSGISFSGKHAAEYAAYMRVFGDIPYAYIVFFLLLALSCGFMYRHFAKNGKSGYILGYSLTGVVVSLYLVLDGLLLPSVYDVKSDYYVANEIRRLVPAGKIWDYRKDFVVGQRDRMHQFSINFYLGDRIVPLDQNRPKTGFLIMGDDDISTFVSSYPEYCVKKIRRFEHRSCDDKRTLTLYTFSKR